MNYDKEIYKPFCSCKKNKLPNKQDIAPNKYIRNIKVRNGNNEYSGVKRR